MTAAKRTERTIEVEQLEPVVLTAEDHAWKQANPGMSPVRRISREEAEARYPADGR